jgi:TolB-like protein/class 3 adenylate cyclase/Tfp pilus assembly protein PilF
MRLGSTALATDRVERRLAAILAADVAGYSRLMGADEEGTHERLKAHLRELVDPKIKEHRGRIVKITGDGLLAEFLSAVNAVRCAAEIQRGMVDRNADVPEDKRIRFRIGVNLGDVIVEPKDIFGDGVNIAARLEALAEPGGLCISRTVYDQVAQRTSYPFEDIGEPTVKNIARPVRAYRIGATAVACLPRTSTIAEADEPANPSTAPSLSIVVLPFLNLSNDPEQEYFADGITDDLTTDLSRISGSFVIARNTAFTYKGKPVDAKQIGQELGVRYILEGSIRRSGHRARINVQLIDADNGGHLWAERFDAHLANLSDAEDEITVRLAQTLSSKLIDDVGRRLEQQRSTDLHARDLIMRGRALFNRPYSAATLHDAQQAYERALDKDPGSIDAKVGIASALLTKMANAWSTSREHDAARAEQLLIEALERNANNASARAMMGLLRRLQDRLTESRIEWEAAIALDPNNVTAIRQLGYTLMHLGDPEGAIPLIEKGIRLSPQDAGTPGAYQVLGLCHLLRGNLELAIHYSKRSRAGNPRLYYTHTNLAAALALEGNLEEAKFALAEAIKVKSEPRSLAQMRASLPYANPKYLALLEKTVFVGLRRAGLPEQ